MHASHAAPRVAPSRGGETARWTGRPVFGSATASDFEDAVALPKTLTKDAAQELLATTDFTPRQYCGLGPRAKAKVPARGGETAHWTGRPVFVNSKGASGSPESVVYFSALYLIGTSHCTSECFRVFVIVYSRVCSCNQ